MINLKSLDQEHKKEIYIVTVKLWSKNLNHDPHNKQTGRCKFSFLCTDVTGRHHCFLVIAYDIREVKNLVKKSYGNIHVTRIEKGLFL